VSFQFISKLLRKIPPFIQATKQVPRKGPSVSTKSLQQMLRILCWSAVYKSRDTTFYLLHLCNDMSFTLLHIQWTPLGLSLGCRC